MFEGSALLLACCGARPRHGSLRRVGGGGEVFLSRFTAFRPMHRIRVSSQSCRSSLVLRVSLFLGVMVVVPSALGLFSC